MADGHQSWHEYRKEIKSLIISEGVTSIAKSAFYGYPSLASVSIPKSITYIGAEAFSFSLWFEEQVKNNPLIILNQILIDGSNAYTDAIIPNGVISIAPYAFNDAYNLKSITIPETVVNIDKDAISHCTNLERIYGFSATAAESLAETLGVSFIPIPLYMQAGLGDVNFDKMVSVEDAQLTLVAYVKAMSKLNNGLTTQQIQAADINRDTLISIEDAQLILLYYVSNTLIEKPISWYLILHPETSVISPQTSTSTIPTTTTTITTTTTYRPITTTSRSALVTTSTPTIMSTTTTRSDSSTFPPYRENGHYYVLNTNTMKFHDPSCSDVKRINIENRQDATCFREDLTALGYSACGRCKP